MHQMQREPACNSGYMVSKSSQNIII